MRKTAVYINSTEISRHQRPLNSYVFSIDPPAAEIIAIMGSRHQPLHGSAPPILFDNAQSLHNVAVATYPSSVLFTNQFAQP